MQTSSSGNYIAEEAFKNSFVQQSRMTTQFDLYSMQLPLAGLTTSNHLIGEAHQFLGNMFIFFVGLHAAAALAHHFIFKGGVLKSMLAKNDK